MSALVYQAINAVAAELAVSGIAKTRHNEQGNYAYRGIEDVLSALAPLLATHKLCILPRVLEREAIPRKQGASEQRVLLRVAFELVSAIDGSSHRVESFGEALDDSDKGTAKAMSAAYKSAMLQVFCIPVPEEEANGSLTRIVAGKRVSADPAPEPPEGWESWSTEVVDIARACETADAIERLLGTRRHRLSALQRARPELYGQVGEAIAGRLSELQRPSSLVSEASSSRNRNNAKNDGANATAAAA